MIEKPLLYPFFHPPAPAAFVPEQWQCVQSELDPCRVAICLKRKMRGKEGFQFLSCHVIMWHAGFADFPVRAKSVD